MSTSTKVSALREHLSDLIDLLPSSIVHEGPTSALLSKMKGTVEELLSSGRRGKKKSEWQNSSSGQLPPTTQQRVQNDSFRRRTSDPFLAQDAAGICLTVHQFVLKSPASVSANLHQIFREDRTERETRLASIGKRLQTIGKLIGTLVAISGCENMSTLLQTMKQKMLELLAVHRVTIFQYDERTDELVGRDETGLVIRSRLNKGITGHAGRLKMSIFSNECQQSSQFHREVDETIVATSHNILCVPIVNPNDKKLYGVLQLCNKSTKFNSDDEFIGSVVASQLRVVIQQFNQKEALSKELSRCSALIGVVRDLNSDLETSAVVNNILGLTKRLVNAERASFFHVDYEREILTTTIDGQEIRIPLQSGLVGRAVTTGRSLNVADTSKEPLWYSSVDEKTGFTTKSIMTVPILHSQDDERRVVGVIQMINKTVASEESSFSDDDLITVESFANFAGIALNNSKLFGMSQRSEKIARRLLGTMKELSSTLCLEELLSAITHQARKLLDADRGTVFLIDRTTNELWTPVADGIMPIRIPLGKGIAGFVAETGQVLNIPDVYQDSRFYSNIDKETGYRTRSILCMPIFNYRSTVIGVTQIINKANDEAFTREDEELLRGLNRDAGVFITNSRRYEQAVINEQRATELAEENQSRYMNLESKVLMKIISERARILSNATHCTLFLLNSDTTQFVSLDHQEPSIPTAQIRPKFNPGSNFFEEQTSEGYVIYAAIVHVNDILGLLKVVSPVPFREDISHILDEISRTAHHIIRRTFFTEAFAEDEELAATLSSEAVQASQLFQRTEKMHRYLEAVLSTIDHLVFCVDQYGCFVRSNHPLDAIGLPNEVLVRMPCSEWAVHCHPNNERFFQLIVDCHEQKRSLHHELFEYFLTDKESRFIRFSVLPLFYQKIEGQRTQGTVVILEDITTNKRLNQSLEIFQSSAMELVSPGFNSSIQLQSLLRMMLRVLSGSRILFFRGDSFRTLHLAHNYGMAKTSLVESAHFVGTYDEDLIREAIDTRELVFTAHREDAEDEFGDVRHTSYRGAVCSPLLVGEQLRGVIYLEGLASHALSPVDKRILLVFSSVVTCYIEVQRRIEENQSPSENLEDGEIHQLKGRLHESERTKAEFLMNMSHELRTPLNAVIGTTELLLTTQLNEQQVQFVETVSRASALLLLRIDDILDYSKVDSGQMVLESNPFDLRATLEDTIDVLSDQYSERNIELCLDLNIQESCRLRGDPFRVRQVLMNIIGNACKFSHPHSAVHVVVSRSDKANAHLGKDCVFHFKVIDRGIGISSESQKRLFTPFSQGDESTTRNFEGTGLGLAIARHLIRLMSGDIFVQSQLGKGTEVSFWCRFQLETSRNNPVAPPSPCIALSSTKQVVLISTFASCSLLASMLRSWDLQVTVFHSFSSECESLLREEQSDSELSLLIIDSNLLRVKHISQIVSQRKGDSSLPILAIKNKFEPASEVAHITLPVTGSILIPLRKNQLESSLRKVVVPSHAAEKTPTVEKKKSTLSLSSAATQIRVLVVEDNSMNRKVITKQLERVGVRPDVAENGKIAVDICQQQEYQLILMDCHMPVMDGYDATKAIRKLEQDEHERERATIVALTADALVGTRDACLAAGMDAYYTKPLLHKHVVEIMKNYGRKE